MYLIPYPCKLIFTAGSFLIDRNIWIVMDYRSNDSDFGSCKILAERIKEYTGLDIHITKASRREGKCIYIKKQYNKREGYMINITEEGAEINGGDEAGLFYSIMTFCQIIKQEGLRIPCLIIEDEPHFKNRGFYHDVTRGKVPSLDTLKELVDRVSSYKINQLQLYIEHTFAFEQFSEVWIGKDALTGEDILTLDQYCRERHVELVPSIATFGHLYEVLRSKTYSELCELENSTKEPFSWISRMKHHTLDVSNEKSIELVEYMIKEFIPLFSSNKFNICCDETLDLGRGRNRDKINQSNESVGRIYVDFLNKIINCVKKYGKEVMFWGDIILKHPVLLNEVPKDVLCLNWYYGKECPEQNVRTIFESGLKQYVCPGVSGWNRLMNDMETSFTNTRNMIGLGKKYNALGVLNTDWGDYGHVNLFSNSMPEMIYGAALSWNADNNQDDAEMEKAISAIDFGDNTESIVSTLKELSKEEKVTWRHMVEWMEGRKLDNQELKLRFENFCKSITIHELEKGYVNALKIEKQLYKYFGLINNERIQDLKEFIVSARGIALMNEFFLVLKKFETGDENISLVTSTNNFAVEFEYWFLNYERAWRERNRESELNKIREAVMYISSYLRSLNYEFN